MCLEHHKHYFNFIYLIYTLYFSLVGTQSSIIPRSLKCCYFTEIKGGLSLKIPQRMSLEKVRAYKEKRGLSNRTRNFKNVKTEFQPLSYGDNADLFNRVVVRITARCTVCEVQ